MAVFYSFTGTLETEKAEFLQCLYHDKKNGQAIRLIKNGNAVTQYSTYDLTDLAATGTDEANIYTSVNSFRGAKRTSVNIFNFCSIYIDIDCHFDAPDQIQAAKVRTVEILEAAYASGQLVMPTMITDTGRGFGLQYVLQKSIANIDKTSGQQAFYRTVRKCLTDRYGDILSSDPMAGQVDASAMDDSRVCRMPGTYNPSAGAYCRLISKSDRFYELSEIVKGCHLWTWVDDKEYQARKEARKKRTAGGKIVSINEYRYPFLSARLDQLRKLQDLRGDKCTNNCREQLLFIGYSALVQLDRDTAGEQLQLLNSRFAEPLAQAELDHIIVETDANIGNGYRGYYKLTNRYLVERLNLSADEIRAMGLDMGWHRTAARQAARQEKQDKRDKVIGLLQQADGLTYQQIADAVGVSRRTVCTIAKDEGLTRYDKVAKTHADDRVEQADKSANCAIKSVCVEAVLSGGVCLATPVEMGPGEEETYWYDWLSAYASVSVIARELLGLFSWSTSFVAGGAAIEDYFDVQMPSVVAHPERLQMMLDNTAKLYVDTYGVDECVCTLQEDIIDYPSILNLCGSKRRKPERKKWVTDLDTETSEQRDARMKRHLSRYEDRRFEIIESTEEYKRRLDFDVLREIKITCMQVQRLKREYLYVEGQQIPTAEIRQCFDALSYKDIVVICERIGHQGTIKRVGKPFFYIVQAVYKYRHPELAKRQENRLAAEKASQKRNKFHNFEQRDTDFAWIEFNAVRELMGLPVLTHDEYCELMKGRA